MTKKGRKGIFVPLTREAFSWYFQGKTWELRKAEGPWNRKRFAAANGGVALSFGYSGPRIYCNLWNSIVFGSLERIFGLIPFKEIVPPAKSKNDAIRIARDVLGPAAEYVAFELDIWGPDGFMLGSSWDVWERHQKSGKIPTCAAPPRRYRLWQEGKRSHPRLDIPGCTYRDLRRP